MAAITGPTIVGVETIAAICPGDDKGKWLHLRFGNVTIGVFFDENADAKSQAYADAVNAVTERLKAEREQEAA